MWQRILSVALVLCASSLACAISINEIRIDQPTADNDEYFELAGSPGESLDSLTYLVIGEGVGGSGTIEAVISLEGQSIPSDGYFLAVEPSFGTAGLPFGDAMPDFVTTINFSENDNLTHVLVDGFFGSLHDDLDIDNDGALDETPWSAVVDAVCLIEDPGVTYSEHYYCGDLGGSEVGPDGANSPAHVYRIPDRDGPFQIGFFPSGGDPGFIDTPGKPNEELDPADCDFDEDGDCDGDDIDALVFEIAADVPDVDFDMDGNGVIDGDDLDEWLEQAGAMRDDSDEAYLYGDANLDGNVDGQDFIAWNIGKFTETAKWTLGDFNADGQVDGQDFLVWNGNKFMSSDGFLTVPEPVSGAGCWGLGLLWAMLRARRDNRRS